LTFIDVFVHTKSSYQEIFLMFKEKVVIKTNRTAGDIINNGSCL
jgi:hypothetical protein